MKKLLIIIIIQITSFYAFTQKDYTDYYQLTAKAFTYYVTGDYSNAVKRYEEAFSLFFPFPDDVNMLKKCYLKQNDKEKGYEAMKRMVLCGYKLDQSVSYIICDERPMLTKYTTTTNSGDSLLESKLLSDYPELRKEYLKQVDTELDRYLKVLTDFEIFSRIMRAENSDRKNKEYKLIQDAGFETEKLLFMNLLKKDIDLDRAKTDSWSSDLTAIFLIHTSQSTTKSDYASYFKLLKEQVVMGNVYNLQYAICYDNTYFRLFGKTVYGQSFDFDMKKGINKCRPVEDVKNVDKRRADLGLPPLWVWCEYFDMELPEGYIIPME